MNKKVEVTAQNTSIIYLLSLLGTECKNWREKHAFEFIVLWCKPFEIEFS